MIKLEVWEWHINASVDRLSGERHRRDHATHHRYDMDEAQQSRADDLFEETLKRSNAKDPRDFYRERLREMKATDPDAYREAVEYYQEELIPSIAEKGADPVSAWQEYGCRLAELSSPGKPVEVDVTGRAHRYQPPTPQDRMILHIPEGSKGRALVVGLPAELSSAQRATYELLVAGRQRLRE